MEIKTLTAKRVLVKTPLGTLPQTELYTPAGTLVAKIPPALKQPQKGKKQIVINSWTYNLQWT